MNANLEQTEAALTTAIQAFNEECGFLFDFTDFKARAATLETMAEVAQLRGKPALAERLQSATGGYFSALNASIEAPQTPRWQVPAR